MSPSSTDRFLILALRGCACVTGILSLLIVVFLTVEALPALRHVGLHRFFLDTSWHPTEKLFGALPMLTGTLLATAGAVLLATPLGILSALFCRFFAPVKLAKLYRNILQVLAGIPSVVYGFWGLVVLVPLIASRRPPGASLLAGILILTVMILPTMALTAEASFAAVPLHYMRGAAALGLDRWSTIRGVVFPAAKSGLFTGLVLETGRAIGETMAVLMVCGNVIQTPKSLFEPMRTLTAGIALEMAYALGDHRSALFVCALLLLAVVVALALTAELLDRQVVQSA